MSDDARQLPLFDYEPESPVPGPGEVAPTGLTPDTGITDALEVYLDALRFGGASMHTVKAFRSDLNLLARWAGLDKPVGTFGTADLNRFLHWMLNERGKPCSPKTYARRVTALKNFFGYLYEMQVIPSDPSAAVIQKRVSSPLPEVLYEDEIGRVLDVTQRLRNDSEKPDARPHLLVTLLFQTGIKKSECTGLHLEHIDRANAGDPILWVRYDNPRLRYKERKIKLKPGLLEVLDEYLHQRKPGGVVFDCTARNLEYVLRDVAELADVPPKKLSFEALRWTCALRDYLDGMDPEALRQKLGLSRISWRETSTRLKQLAEEVEPRD
jgi:site-specific recombinase XerD